MGDNTGGGVVMLLPIMFQCVVILISSGFHIYTYIYVYIYTHTYIYSVSICPNFDMGRAIRNVTIA